jgi:hypothetical protein
MLYREVIAVCSQIKTKHMETAYITHPHYTLYPTTHPHYTQYPITPTLQTVQHVTVLNIVGNCNTTVSVVMLY